MKTKQLSLAIASSIAILISAQSTNAASDAPKQPVTEAASAEAVSPIEAVETPEVTPCHWWQRECRAKQKTPSLPPEAPTNGPVIAVDTDSNQVYFFRDGEMVAKSPAATGSEKYLKHGLKEWIFHTPRGRMKVLRKMTDPVWTKPDWAFVEDHQKIPPPDSPKRKVQGHLGKYALDLGDGIMIHGTDDPSSLGKKVSHGCIRVGDEMLTLLYKNADVGTPVYIY